MTKKEIAVSFLKMAGSGDVQKAYDKFVAPAFIHHNQYFKGDRAVATVEWDERSIRKEPEQIDRHQECVRRRKYGCHALPRHTAEHARTQYRGRSYF